MKEVLGVVMVAAVTVALTGCSGFDDEPAAQAVAAASQADNAGSGDAPAKGMIYGIYKTGGQIWFTDEGEVAKKIVEQRGDEFIHVDARVSPEEYLRAINNAVASQVKGVITCIPDQIMSQVIMDKCKEARIPMVVCNDAPQNDVGDKLAPWVGISAYVIGQANGDWLAAYAKDNNLAEDERCGLLLLTIDTVFSCVPRAEGKYGSFTANCPDFPAERIFRADYDGATDKESVAATSVTTAHPEIKKWPVTGANEEGTIGAVQVLESAGLNGDTYVVGPGAYVAKSGWNDERAEGTCMKAATYFSSGFTGKGPVEILCGVAGGKESPPEATVDAIVTTPESYREVVGKAAE